MLDKNVGTQINYTKQHCLITISCDGCMIELNWFVFLVKCPAMTCCELPLYVNEPGKIKFNWIIKMGLQGVWHCGFSHGQTWRLIHCCRKGASPQRQTCDVCMVPWNQKLANYEWKRTDQWDFLIKTINLDNQERLSLGLASFPGETLNCHAYYE